MGIIGLLLELLNALLNGVTDSQLDETPFLLFVLAPIIDIAFCTGKVVW